MHLKFKIHSLRSHPLFQTLANNKGNPRTLILIEPLWGIPFNLITPFTTLYMYLQGVTDMQIGLILSVTMIVQVLFSFLGGILTDKLGRKITTILGDFFGWSIACLLWAISDNFWMFLFASVLNSFEQINQTAWYCLLIEDVPPRDLVGIYTWITIGGLISVFFAPLSGLLVNMYSIVPVVRVLYFLFSFTMLLKVAVTFLCCHETRQGVIRRRETKHVSSLHMLGEYRRIIPELLRNKTMLRVVAVSVILYVAAMISTNFFGLYVTQQLALSENYLALFPILNAAIMLVFMVYFQSGSSTCKFRAPLWAGLGLSIAGVVVLLCAPEMQLVPVLVYVLLTAAAAALINPRKDALLQLNILPGERARVNALILALTVAFSSPFGYFTGWLSGIDRRLPFGLMVLLFVSAMLLKTIPEPQVDPVVTENQ